MTWDEWQATSINHFLFQGRFSNPVLLTSSSSADIQTYRLGECEKQRHWNISDSFSKQRNSLDKQGVSEFMFFVLRSTLLTLHFFAYTNISSLEFFPVKIRCKGHAQVRCLSSGTEAINGWIHFLWRLQGPQWHCVPAIHWRRIAFRLHFYFLSLLFFLSSFYHFLFLRSNSAFQQLALRQALGVRSVLGFAVDDSHPPLQSNVTSQKAQDQAAEEVARERIHHSATQIAGRRLHLPSDLIISADCAVQMMQCGELPFPNQNAKLSICVKGILMNAAFLLICMPQKVE